MNSIKVSRLISLLKEALESEDKELIKVIIESVIESLEEEK